MRTSDPHFPSIGPETMKANAPAFPTQESPQPQNDDGLWNQEWKPLQHGLTKREWFAGLAMQSIFMRPVRGDFETTIKFAVEIADALLLALEDDE